MTFGNWFDGRRARVSDRRPARRPGLRLEALDERAVPDATSGGVPPPVGPPQGGQPTTTLLTVTAGGTSVYDHYDASGKEWVVALNPTTGWYSATLVSYQTPVVPTAADGFAQEFVPDAGLPSLVWDPNTGTYFTVAAGTVFPADVTGSSDGGWNVVSLALAPGFSADATRNIDIGGEVTMSLQIEPTDPNTRRDLPPRLQINPVWQFPRGGLPPLPQRPGAPNNFPPRLPPGRLPPAPIPIPIPIPQVPNPDAPRLPLEWWT